MFSVRTKLSSVLEGEDGGDVRTCVSSVFFHSSTLPAFPPPPSTPISICNGSQPSFLLLYMLSYTPLYSYGSPRFALHHTASTHSFASLINTPSVTNMAMPCGHGEGDMGWALGNKQFLLLKSQTGKSSLKPLL